MQRSNLPLLACILAFACNLNAQEIPPYIRGEAKPVAKVPASDLEDELESPSEVAAEAAELPTTTVEKKDVEGEADSAASSKDDLVEAIDTEANEISSESEAEESDGEEDEEAEGPVFVSVNEEGRLTGMVTAIVTGEPVPIEANVSLVRDGVLLSKIVANEDGSFAFPNINPGDYNMYGSASSYCGQQAFTVLPSESCTVCDDNVSLELAQGGSCYKGLSGAPAASFSNGGTGGLVGSGGGSFFSGGGGFVGSGGSAVAGRSGLRLLAIGGVATAIAVGVSDDDDASPSE